MIRRNFFKIRSATCRCQVSYPPSSSSSAKRTPVGVSSNGPSRSQFSMLFGDHQSNSLTSEMKSNPKTRAAAVAMQ